MSRQNTGRGTPANSTMSASEPDMDQLERDWGQLKSSDAMRHELISRLFSHVNELVDENKELRDEIESLKFHERNFRKERKLLLEESGSLRDRVNASPFVMVLIDGDNTLFRDAFVQAGVNGGHQAAQTLAASLDIYSRELLGEQAHRKIVVRIYFNKFGLIRTYARARIIPEERVGEGFVVGFNRELPHVEFVDVGQDKEAADNKIRENFTLYWNNEHCKHIILAGSADKGYVNFLRQYRASSGITARLTLIESTPFPAEFGNLSSSFKTKKFDDVFRNAKITFEEPAASGWPVLKHNYASTPAVTPAVPVLRPKISTPLVAPAAPAPTAAPEPKIRRISYNKDGQRIDEPLPVWEPDLLDKFRSRGFCNRAVLTKCDNPYCQYEHGVKLNTEEKKALARIARLSKCPNGAGCEDRDCVAAHQCSYGSRCKYGDSCRFDPEEHSIDKTVAEVY